MVEGTEVGIRIVTSYDSFRELRESGCYYVDKTGMLGEFLVDRFEKCVLFARPRRFGKTLTVTMLRDFLDARQDSRAIFEGLKVMDRSEVVEGFMNRWPVIFISLKEVFGDDFDAVLGQLGIAVFKACGDNAHLAQSAATSEVDRLAFRKLWLKEAKQGDVEQSLALLARMLRARHGRPAFVIVDEYDVPMAKALGTPHYERVRDMVERLLSHVCKTNEDVKAVVLSGCLYTVKNSAYTGVNNIVPYTVLSPVYASAIGFTDAEVRRLLADAGIPGRYAEAEATYDGYLFGREPRRRERHA